MTVPLCLMYHNVAQLPARKNAPLDAHARYWLSPETFAAHLDVIAGLGFAFLAPDDIVSSAVLPERGVLLTFDDSWAGHADSAKMLSSRSIRALFFLNPASFGRPYMLTAEAAASISSLGHEVGSHGMTHTFFTRLPDAGLAASLADSKSALESACSRPVRFLSPPGGRLDSRLASLARAAGYARVFTSRPGFIPVSSRPFLLNRIPITADITPERLRKTFTNPVRTVAPLRARYSVLSFLRRMIE